MSHMLESRIEKRAKLRVVYIRKFGAYGQETCEAAFNELCAWAEPRSLMEQGRVYEVYWDDPEKTPAEKCRVDACLTIADDFEPGDTIKQQVLSAGRYAVCSFSLKENDFTAAWEEAFNWVKTTGLNCADLPCFEEYLERPEDNPEQNWKLNICIPLTT